MSQVGVSSPRREANGTYFASVKMLYFLSESNSEALLVSLRVKSSGSSIEPLELEFWLYHLLAS